MMDQQHKPITVKPIGEVAAYLRNLIPPCIPEGYALKPRFSSVADEGDIRAGVVAFWEFLYLFCDKLTTDGHLYAKPRKNQADYPFIHNITNLLVDMGYYGVLSQSGDALVIDNLPLCAPPKPKIPGSAQAECQRFLSLCGFEFDGVEVKYPDNPLLLVGLKALSIADMELRADKRYWGDNNLLRCDYRLLKSEESNMLDVLRDFLHPLPSDVQNFAVKLHQRYTGMGLTCVNTRLGEVSFAYANLGKSKKIPAARAIYQKRIYDFSYSSNNGFCLFVRAKKTEGYMDVIKTFHPLLQERIMHGYGCDRKRGEPCQTGCKGILIPLDESVLVLADDIVAWLDEEMPKGK